MNRITKLLQSQAKFIYLLFLLIAISGAYAYTKLPSAVYPELTFPRISVIAQVGDVDPDQMVITVTRPLEEAVGQVYGIDWIRSSTIRGATELSVQFQNNTDIQIALQQVQSQVAQVNSTLPTGTNVTVERITPAIFPILSYNISTDTLTQEDLYTITRYQILPKLTQVAGVSQVQIQGGEIPEVEVLVEPLELRSYNLSLIQVADAVQRSTQNTAVGKLDALSQQNLVVASGQPVELNQIENTVVTAKGQGNPIFLRDLGKVRMGQVDPTQIVSDRGKIGVTVNIFRQPNSNVVSVSQGVSERIAAIEKSLPPGVTINPAYDESGLIIDAIANVRDSILIGIGLIIIVLYIFLRDWRSTAIAALTIPLSAIAAFGVLNLLGQSLNLMTLGGLAVAIGLVIDDAIVVIENIDRQLQKDLKPSAAVSAAMGELAGPVISSTATTVAVFLPLGLLSGVAGQFFISLTLALSSAVVFSLLLALILTPLLASRWLKKRTTEREFVLLNKLDATYSWILRRVLRKPLWLGLLAALLLLVGGVLFKQLGTDFLPAFDEGSYLIDYLAPPGTSLSETGTLGSRIEKVLAQTPEIATWTRRTGAESGLFATKPNKGDIVVILKPQSERQRSVFEIIDAQRQQLQQLLPQLAIDFHQILQDQLNDLSGSSNPIEIKIFGDDRQTLQRLSDKVRGQMSKVKGLVDVAASGAVEIPQLNLDINSVQAGQLGLTKSDVAQQVQDAVLGTVATQLRQGDRLIDVRVRLNKAVQQNSEAVAQIPIVGTNNTILPLSAVAKITTVTAAEEILRENLQRYVSIDANLQGIDLGSAVKQIKQQVSAVKLPSGYSLEIGGLYASQQQAFNQLLLVLVLALLLVYIVLVMQFRSFWQPLVIFTAVPLALIGVIVGLWLTQIPLNVSSFMGIILLIGLVVKNGIILLEYTNRLQEEGRTLDVAIVEAGRVRLRPILMTTICAILGLLPLALGLGAGSELQKPLAVAVIGGLSLSTFFTLIFVPVVFRFVSRRQKSRSEN